jgi:hypothetical protein
MATKKAAVKKVAKAVRNVAAKAKTNGTNYTMVFDGVPGAVLSIPAASPYQEGFRVRKQIEDRMSDPVVLKAIHFDQKTREIRAFGSDGMTRKCKVDRLPSLEEGRALFRKLQELGKAQKKFQFIAAGGYSPNVWFYTVK